LQIYYPFEGFMNTVSRYIENNRLLPDLFEIYQARLRIITARLAEPLFYSSYLSLILKEIMK